MKNRAALLLAAACLLSGRTAQANPARTYAGFIVGEPTGFSGKLFLSEKTALDAAVAWSLVKDSRFHIHADWLRHDFTVLKRKFGVTEGEIPLYYGVGGRVRFDRETRAGVRFVAGVSYLFDDAPLDVFFEAAPIMDIVPKTELGLNLGAGLRYRLR